MFLFFRENKAWHFIWIIGCEDDWHEMSIKPYFAWKKNNFFLIFRMPSFALITGAFSDTLEHLQKV